MSKAKAKIKNEIPAKNKPSVVPPVIAPVEQPVVTPPVLPLITEPVVTAPVEPVKEKYSKEIHETMKPYVNAYPQIKEFLISSDGQVFLNTNEQDAKAHQKKLDEKKELINYSI